jgi:hypothetical protein
MVGDTGAAYRKREKEKFGAKSKNKKMGHTMQHSGPRGEVT